MNGDDELEGYEKVRVKLNGVGVGSESFWVKDVQEMTDGSRFGVVDNMLVYAPFRYGDTVRFADDPSGTPRVVEVLQRGPGLWIGMSMQCDAEDWISSPVPQLLLSDAFRTAATTITKAGAQAMAIRDLGMIAGFVPAVDDTRNLYDIAEDFVENSVLRHFEEFFAEAKASDVESFIGFDILSSPESPLGDCGGVIDIREGDPPPEHISPEEAQAIVADALEMPEWFAMLGEMFDEGDLPRHLDTAPGHMDVMMRLIAGVMHDPRFRRTIAAGQHRDALLVAGRSVAAERGLPLPPLDRALLLTEES